MSISDDNWCYSEIVETNIWIRSTRYVNCYKTINNRLFSIGSTYGSDYTMTKLLKRKVI